MAQSATVQNDIDEVYQEVLARGADAGGMAAMQAAYAGGATLDDIRASLANSTELQNDFASTYAAIGAAPPSTSEAAAFARIMSASYDTPLTVMNANGVIASTTAGNVLSELPALETISDGRTLTLSMPDGSTQTFNGTSRLADFAFAVAVQKSQATSFTLDVLKQDVGWLDQVDQPMLDLANRETDLAALNTTTGNSAQAALARFAAGIAAQIAGMPVGQRTQLTQTTVSNGHKVQVTVYPDSGEANGTPLRFHNIDPGILGILEQVGVVVLNVAAILAPETGLPYAAAVVDAAEAAKAFANGQVIAGILDLAAAAGGVTNGLGAIDVATDIAIASEAVGGVYRLVQGIQNGDVLGTIAGILEVAAAAASGAGQLDSDIKDLTARIAKGLNIAATVTAVSDQFIKGNVAGGLVASLGAILNAIATEYTQRQAEITNQIGYAQITPQNIGTPTHMSFVGGLADDTSHQLGVDSEQPRTMEGAEIRYAADHPGTDVRYFTHDQATELDSFIKSTGGNVTIVAHSWGADTAASVVAAWPEGLKVNDLIGLDPVSYARPDYSAVRAHSLNWADYNASSSALSLPNVIAGGGSAWGQSPAACATSFANVNVDHGQIENYSVIKHILGQ